MTLRPLWTLLFACGIGATLAAGSDWPQWQGPNRNGLSSETGLMSRWPAPGPAQVWSATGLGGGYGSMAIAGDRIFLQGSRGNRQSFVSVLQRADGKGMWSKALGSCGAGGSPRIAVIAAAVRLAASLIAS
jgi:hypothetical protein